MKAPVRNGRGFFVSLNLEIRNRTHRSSGFQVLEKIIVSGFDRPVNLLRQAWTAEWRHSRTYKRFYIYPRFPRIFSQLHKTHEEYWINSSDFVASHLRALGSILYIRVHLVFGDMGVRKDSAHGWNYCFINSMCLISNNWTWCCY